MVGILVFLWGVLAYFQVVTETVSFREKLSKQKKTSKSSNLHLFGTMGMTIKKR